jgi:hypothetical protein
LKKNVGFQRTIFYIIYFGWNEESEIPGNNFFNEILGK